VCLHSPLLSRRRLPCDNVPHFAIRRYALSRASPRYRRLSPLLPAPRGNSAPPRRAVEPAGSGRWEFFVGLWWGARVGIPRSSERESSRDRFSRFRHNFPMFLRFFLSFFSFFLALSLSLSPSLCALSSSLESSDVATRWIIRRARVCPTLVRDYGGGHATSVKVISNHDEGFFPFLSATGHLCVRRITFIAGRYEIHERNVKIIIEHFSERAVSSENCSSCDYVLLIINLVFFFWSTNND